MDDEKLCVWFCGEDSYNYDTNCGHTYFPHIRSENQPEVVDNICPWCKKKIEYREDSEEEV